MKGPKTFSTKTGKNGHKSNKNIPSPQSLRELDGKVDYL